MKRYELMQLCDGVKAAIAVEAQKLNEMLMDTTSKLEDRNAQEQIIMNLEARYDSAKAQFDKLDAQEKAALPADVALMSDNERKITAKAALIRATMARQPVTKETLDSLGGVIKNTALIADDTTGGNKFLPKTVSSDIITEPFVKNPLRDVCVVSSETNLELPKILFTIDDDDFIEDGATAKELEATGDTVAFGRFKSKIFCDISETVLNGTAANLVGTVENALASGLAAKEKKMQLATTTAAPTAHMSFYSKTAGEYDIAEVNGTTKYKAIKAAIADLHESFRENAKVMMTYADYLDIIETLANGNATLYGVQPEQIIGKPVLFCDGASIPVVGDFKYAQINYDPAMLYETDKNIKTGMNSFVVTAWYDIQFKLRSAFRLAVVEEEISV